MLQVECFTLGPLATNAYLLTVPGEKRGVVIDPGISPGVLMDKIGDLEIEAILLTHAHFDHIGGVDELRSLKQCPVYLHEIEADWLTDAEKNGSLMWPDISRAISSLPAEHSLKGGMELNLLGHTLQVLHTPGHSPGSVSFLGEDCIFSGDVLFHHSVGRTDLPGGSSQQLYQSIHEKLFTLEMSTVVYPGHGPETSISKEKLHNPYV